MTPGRPRGVDEMTWQTALAIAEIALGLRHVGETADRSGRRKGKLTDAERFELQALRDAGSPLRELADRFGVSVASAGRIAKDRDPR